MNKFRSIKLTNFHTNSDYNGELLSLKLSELSCYVEGVGHDGTCVTIVMRNGTVYHAKTKDFKELLTRAESEE